MQRDLRNSSFEHANRDRSGFFREVPFVIKPTVIKTTNIKLNFITAGFSNFPVLCASPLRLPWSLPVSNFNSILVSLSNYCKNLKFIDSIFSRISSALLLGVYCYLNKGTVFVDLGLSLSEYILYSLLLINFLYITPSGYDTYKIFLSK